LLLHSSPFPLLPKPHVRFSKAIPLLLHLVGQLRVEAGSGSDVTVEIQRAARMRPARRAVGTAGRRETLRIIYPDDVIVMPSGVRLDTTLRVRDDGTSRGTWTP